MPLPSNLSIQKRNMLIQRALTFQPAQNQSKTKENKKRGMKEQKISETKGKVRPRCGAAYIQLSHPQNSSTTQTTLHTVAANSVPTSLASTGLFLPGAALQILLLFPPS